jgi:hypothetical protein
MSRRLPRSIRREYYGAPSITLCSQLSKTPADWHQSAQPSRKSCQMSFNLIVSPPLCRCWVPVDQGNINMGMQKNKSLQPKYDIWLVMVSRAKLRVQGS